MLRKIADRLLAEQGEILIACHRTPDGDTIGAGLAVFLWLKGLGKNAEIYCADPVPGLYSFLPGTQEVRSEAGNPPDVLVAVDCASADRINDEAGSLLSKSGLTISIDHHATNPLFAAMNHIAGNAGSTSELIAEMLSETGQHISKDIADCLYTGIVTDTGQFGFDYTRPESLRMAAMLMEHGADFEGICFRMFRRKTLSRAKLVASALSSLRLYAGGRIAAISIPQQVLNEIGAGPDECENIVNETVEIDGVEVGFMLRETQSREWKVSLRASGTVDVSKIAKGYGGGGHVKAAGCTLPGPMEAAEKKIVEAAEAAISAL
jgi:bifunctional oligoribonuclease and PAP phosphatase NrnA